MKVRPKTALRITGLSASLVFVLLSGGWVLQGNLLQEKAENPLPSKKIGYFIYLNEEVSAALLVDVELAKLRKTDAYIPLAFQLANKGVQALKIKRQSFQLLDPAGSVYEMPAYKTVEKAYKNYSADARYFARKVFVEGDVQTSFSSFRKLQCSFFPHPYKDSILHDVLIEEVELPQGTYIQDMIYFPRPKSVGPGQVFRLRILDKEPESSIEVGFIID